MPQRISVYYIHQVSHSIWVLVVHALYREIFIIAKEIEKESVAQWQYNNTSMATVEAQARQTKLRPPQIAPLRDPVLRLAAAALLHLSHVNFLI